MPPTRTPLRFRIRPELQRAIRSRPRVSLPDVNTLGFLVTMRCTAACRHCAFRSHPGRNEVIDIDFARGVIDQARTVFPGLVMISLSGGEPFAVPDLVKRLVSHASRLGLYSAVVTNAFWATTSAQAVRCLAPLRAQGLIDFTTSLDEFHAPFVARSNIRHAVITAQDLGMRVHINVAAGNDPDYRAQRLPTLLDLGGDRFERANAITVAEFTPVAAGFGRYPRIHVTSGAREVARMPCLSILRAPCVNVQGDFFACCGVGGATDSGPGKLLRVGDLGHHSLRELKRRLQSNLLFGLLATIGPAGLFDLAIRSVGEAIFDPAGMAGDPCSICQMLHDSHDAQSMTARLLEVLSRSLLDSQRIDTRLVS